jgi:hypothetical protein
LEQTLEKPFEALETIPEDDVPDDKDKEISELQEQLKKAHLVIAQLQHDNRELKKTVLERAPKTSERTVTKEAPSVTKSKGKGEDSERGHSRGRSSIS